MATKRRNAAQAAVKHYVVNYPWGLNLRAGPGVNHPILRVLEPGEIVEAKDPGKDEWAAVENGWVMARYLLEV